MARAKKMTTVTANGNRLEQLKNILFIPLLTMLVLKFGPKLRAYVFSAVLTPALVRLEQPLNI